VRKVYSRDIPKEKADPWPATVLIAVMARRYWAAGLFYTQKRPFFGAFRPYFGLK
jgi:hypothetical protein